MSTGPASSRLSLHFTCENSHTRLHILKQDPPLRVLRAFPNDSAEAVVHLHNVSGGVLGGDSLTLEVTAQPSARAQITTTSATRVYPRRQNRPAATQTTHIQLAENSFPEYLPDPVILFAHAAFTPSTHIQLSPGSGLIWWETLALGRIASGESALFTQYAVNTAIHAPGRPIALEHYTLEPHLRDLRSAARLGKFTYSTSLYICNADADQSRWPALECGLSEIAEELTGQDARWGVSTLSLNGIVVRGLATQAHQVTSGLHRFWAKAKPASGTGPPCRRVKFTKSISHRGEPKLHLTPREQEKLMVFVAAEVARRRRARGLKLNYPEALAILTAEILSPGRPPATGFAWLTPSSSSKSTRTSPATATR